MRSVAVLAVLALVAVALAGCSSEDPERYPNGVPSSTSKSTSGSATGSTTKTSTSSSTSTQGTGGNGTGNNQTGPVANLTATPMNGTAPLNVTFVLSGNGTSWTFLFGDGNKTNGTVLPATLVHEFMGGGNFTPTLRVLLGSANATAVVNITVAPGSVGFAPGLDPACQGDPQVTLPPAGEASYYIETRDTTNPMGSSQWTYQESNDIPGLQYTNAEGTAPVLGAGDFDPLGANCENGDTLIV